MKKQTKRINTLIHSVVKKTLSSSANSTTCVYVHQPKAPEALKKFSKIPNDK